MTVQDIARQREIVAVLESERDVIQQRIYETALGIDWKNRFDAVNLAEEKLKALENSYRETGIKIYIESGTKQFDGGDVRIRKSYDYNNDLAREWIIKHDHLELFKIDNTKFLKVAKAVELPLLEITEKPTFYLSKDLSEFLEVSNEE